MSDAELGALVFIGFVVLVAIIAMRRPSEKDLDRTRIEKEHEIEMIELERKRQEIVSRPRTTSGKGKVVKAKRI